MKSHSSSDRTADARALLLMGVPGVGKTTVIQKVAHHMSAGTVRGFFTEEIREGGVRKGFRLVPFDGQTRVLAHVDYPSRFRVGKYGVDVGMLEELAASLLQPDPAAALYVIDEIGKMECLSSRFVISVRLLLDAGLPLLATVAQRGGGLIAEVKKRPDVALWPVTRGNRETVPARVIEWVKARSVRDLEDTGR